MNDYQSVIQNMEVTQPNHLPIIADFCDRIELVESVNSVVQTNMAVDVGTIVQAMVLDTLSGRSPLYRLADFFASQDTELLLGKAISASALNDTTVGRAMDAVFQAGAEKVFNEISLHACKKFHLQTDCVHFDTTSVNVWGDYPTCTPEDEKLYIGHGHSKDHRPDLKQFLIKMLCVERNIPILGGCEDGNASDKKVNNALLSRIAKHMARHGIAEGEYIYIADSAMVTEDNLLVIGNTPFITRLPFTYKEASRVVSEAVAADCWTPLGILNKIPATSARPAAYYRIKEDTVTLYGKEYRSVVIHSTAHDKRRLKRIDREINSSKTELQKRIPQDKELVFYCKPDAEAAAYRLGQCETEFHRLETSVTEKITYKRGRPRKDGSRKVSSIKYQVTQKLVEKKGCIEQKQEEAGCFVLLTNIPLEGEKARPGGEVLQLYKEQHGIERNFSFLKDPLIVNDMFLKKPQRLEVLGCILLISLLIWNLTEHVLRKYVKETEKDLPGWDNKKTRRPTAFMMSTKFYGLQVVKIHNNRQLAKPLTETQLIYLQALMKDEGTLFTSRISKLLLNK